MLVLSTLTLAAIGPALFPRAALADSWVAKEPMPTARGYSVTETVNGKIYVIGGHDGTAPTDVVEEYDPAIDTWTNCGNAPYLVNECEPLSGPRTGAASSVANNKIYLFGGGYSNSPGTALDTVEEYDPINQTTTLKSSMSTVRSVLTSDTVNGRIYLIGGNNNSSPMNVVEEYDPDTDTWTGCGSGCAPMPMPAGKQGINNHASCVIDNKIYVVGGSFGGNDYTDSVQVYDPVANTWEAREPMPAGARNAHTSSVVNGKCFAIGGGIIGDAHVDRVEEYDPQTDEWTEKAEMLTGRARPASSVAGKKIYVFGGSLILDTVEAYNPGVDLEAGLAAYYPFEGNADDASGNGNDGTEHGGVDYDGGVIGLAANFDGIDDSVSVPDSNSLDLTTAGTLSAWVRTHAYDLSVPNHRSIVTKAIGSSQGRVSYHLLYGTHDSYGGAYLQGYAHDGYVNTMAVADANSQSVQDGEWHHVSFVWGGPSAWLYADGELVAREATSAGGAFANSFPLYIGSFYYDPAGWLYTKADIDEVRIYNRALSEDEIEELADATLCGNGTLDPGEACDDGNTADGDGCSSTCQLEDSDGDGVPDNQDICPGFDDNVDSDDDGVPDDCDPCPLDAENDADGDGLCESDDNCPAVANANQNDLDGDGTGDACDPDIDGDGVANGNDNCVFDMNPEQDDFDGDGAGDVCDTDVDGDGVLDADDACVPTTPVGEVVNSDGCSIAELCPCTHPEGGDKWKNHGAYVSCVAHASEDFVAAGLITEAEKDAIVSAAAQSTCGHKNK
jgi:cysteine-rich repeat protein